jgi:uncharacterized protein with FMN-binding domain
MKPPRAAKVMTLALSATATVGLAGLFAKQDDAPSTVAPTTPTKPPSTTTPGTTPSTATPTTTTSDSVALADGVFVGEPDTNRWGTVQVQIVVTDGVVTDVQVLSFPDGDRRSANINERALPELTDDAISAQTADIDSVSGATYTWQSYSVSLQSALDAAAAAA